MIDTTNNFYRLREDAAASRAYFHTWWGLRNIALPKFRATMNRAEFVDFFHLTGSGFLKLTFVSLGKLFDKSGVGLNRLARQLRKDGRDDDAVDLEKVCVDHADLVERVRSIRNKSVSHNDLLLTRDEVYDKYGATPDEIRLLIDEVCQAFDLIAGRNGSSNRISDGERAEKSIIEVLRALQASGA